MGKMKSFDITVTVKGARWQKKRASFERLVTQCTQALLLHEKIKAPIQFAAVLCDDDFIRTLNRDWRGYDKPTNVLSFPAHSPQELRALLKGAEPVELGDLIISGDTVTREASEQGKEVAAHLAHLVIHGLLHLLGDDHLHDREADRMEAKEASILKELGIANPYL